MKKKLPPPLSKTEAANVAYRAGKELADSYIEQLDDIGRVLVASGIISKSDVERDGVRFAVVNKFEPGRAQKLKK